MMLHKTLPASATKGLAPRTFRVVVSSEAVDRDGDRIFLDAWDLRAYKANPVVLAFHDTKSLPVARSTDIGVQGTTLQATVEFPPVGLYDLADRVHDLVQAGFFGAASVGFIPTASQSNPFGGRDVTAAELTEVSLVAIGSNPDALVQRAAPAAMTKWLKRGDLWRPVHDTDSVLTLIDSPSHYKEDPMDSHTIDIVDDNPASVGPMPSANFAAAAALLLARAREIDASFRLLGVNSSIAALVADMMSPEKLPQQRSLADNPFMKVWLKADEDFRAQQLGTRMRQAIAAEQAVPLSQRCVPGFQRTY